MKTNIESSSISEEIFSICALLGYKIFKINNALNDITKRKDRLEFESTFRDEVVKYHRI